MRDKLEKIAKSVLAGETAYVGAKPKCDFCDKPAEFDGQTAMGSWANMCDMHFGQYGTGLGTGRGQKLEAKPEVSEQAMDFETWMAKVNSVVGGLIGLSVADLADKPYRDWYDGGVSPEDAAQTVVEETTGELGGLGGLGGLGYI